MSLLRVQQVEHGYRSGGLLGRGKWLQVLEGIDVQFEAGQTTGLLGSSGSGKSTLARLLLGLERPSQGQVSFAGRDVSRLRGEARAIFSAPSNWCFRTRRARSIHSARLAGASLSPCVI